MKYFWKGIWFIQAFITRLIPMILFFIAHAIGEVYIYNWDPLDFMNIKGIPSMFGSYLFLYGALGLIIMVLFFMKLPIIARTMTIGILISQVFFFLQRWNNYIYDTTAVDPFYRFYMGILVSIIVGFVLQVFWRMILSLGKEVSYKWTLRRSSNRSKKQSASKPIKK